MLPTTDSPTPRTLFLDIGGVLLTNGWDHTLRRRAAQKFGLDVDEMQERHHLTFDTYEAGKLTLDEYLQRVVFFKHRDFSMDAFKGYMYSQASPHPDMLEFMTELKKRYGLRVAAVSNEGRELTVHRIKAFALHRLIDFFISSCFVHLRKPDPEIYQIALDIAQAEPQNVLYIDDRPMFVDVASQLGIPGIVHEDFATTRAKLAEYGLALVHSATHYA